MNLWKQSKDQKSVVITDANTHNPKPQSLMELLAHGTERENVSVDWSVAAEAAQRFFMEWVEDRGDACSPESLRRIAKRSIEAALIFEEEIAAAKQGQK